MTFATSAKTVYLEVSHVLVFVSRSAEETTPLSTHESPLFITKPPPLSPVQGPEFVESPVENKIAEGYKPR